MALVRRTAAPIADLERDVAPRGREQWVADLAVGRHFDATPGGSGTVAHAGRGGGDLRPPRQRTQPQRSQHHFDRIDRP